MIALTIINVKRGDSVSTESPSEKKRITTFEEWQELAKKAKRRWLIYGIEDKPESWGLTIALGIQQYLIMFGATIAVPMILSGIMASTYQLPEEITRHFIAELVTITFFVAGIATLLQTWPKTGSGLPIIQGTSFSFLGPAISIITAGAVIAHLEGYASLDDFIANTDPWTRATTVANYVSTAVFTGALFEIALGYSGIMGKVKRVITPVSIGPTVMMIGLTLYTAPGGTNFHGCWWEGLLVITLIVLLNQIIGSRYVKIQMFSILTSILLAWAIAAGLTLSGVIGGACAINTYTLTEMVRTAKYVRAPIPFPWGPPKFVAAFALGMLAGYLASMVESIGDYHSVCRMSEAPPPTEKMISKGLGSEGLGCFIGGLFGAMAGTTSYSENIGSIGLTRVASRLVFQVGGAIILFLGGILYVWGAFMATMPFPIIAGMYFATFGLIAAVGISLLSLADLKSSRNLFIVGVASFSGLAVPYIMDNANWSGQTGAELVMSAFPPDQQWLAQIVVILLRTGMAVAAIIGILLDNIIPGTPEERGLTHPDWVG